MVVMMAAKPIEKICRSFPDAYEKKNGFWTNDDNPRFDFQEKPDGNISIHSWTGRDAEQILAMGNPPLKLRDLYATKGTVVGKVQHHEKLDLLTLSQYLKLDWQFLEQLGYSDGYNYVSNAGQRTVCVKIGGYCAPDGTPHTKNKVRLSVDPESKFRFVWDQNTPGDPIPCGLHTLPMAAQHGYLIIGEGESDYATMMFHGIPFLGMSGADTQRQLNVSLVLNIPRIYILEEPDQAKKNSANGQGFYKNVRSHLRANGYTGDIFAIRFKDATLCKDPSDLHKILYGKLAMQDETVFRAEIKRQFASALLHARESAIPEGAETQIETVAPYIPPMPTTDAGKLHWIAELLAVPSSVMSDSQKITLATLALHTDILTSPEKRQMDTAHLSDLAAQSSQTFLSNVAYASKNLGLFEKKHEKIWYTDETSGKKKCVTHLFIEPTAKVWAAYPSTYRVAEGLPERKHGGAQTPRPQCPICHSENVDLVETTICHHCHEISHKETYTSPVPLDAINTQRQEPEKYNVNLTEYSAQGGIVDNINNSSTVESTAVILPFPEKKYNVNLTEWNSEHELEEKPTPEEKVQCQLDTLIDSLNKDSQLDRVELPSEEEDTLLCTLCNLDATLAPDEVIFEIDPDDGKPYCPECWEKHNILPTYEETPEEADARRQRDALQDKRNALQETYARIEQAQLEARRKARERQG